MNGITLGLIGLGGWPRAAYLPILAERPDVRVVAVAARSEATRQWARAQFGPDLRLYSDYHDLLADERIQAVTLALPNHLHSAALDAALRTDKHLFVEPPLGLAAAEVDSALDRAAAREAVFQTDLELRYLPVLEELRRRLAAGDFGRPLLARIELWCDWGYGGGNWAQDPSGEGFFLWLGCWYLDVLDVLLGTEPLRAEVIGGRARNGSLLDHGWAVLEYPGPALAQDEADPSSVAGRFAFNLVAVAGRRIAAQVAGTEGEAEADLPSGILRQRRVGQPDWSETPHPASEPVHGFIGLRESLCGFLDAVRTGTPVRADVNVSRRVHHAALACQAAAEGPGPGKEGGRSGWN